MPLLSIITINRNDAPGLQSTAASIAALDFRDFEWLVIDGGSTDDSLQVLSNSPPDRLISEPDAGRYDAMNKGIALASGEYLIFMNAGDCFHAPDSLGFLACKPTGPELLQGHAVFEEYGRRFSVLAHIEGIHSFVRQNPFCHQSLIYRRDALRTLGGFDLAYRVSADFDLTYRYVKAFGCRHCPTLIARFQTGGFGRQNQLQSLADRLRALLRAGPWHVFVPALLSAPYVLAKFGLQAVLAPLGLLDTYRSLRTRLHRVQGVASPGPTPDIRVLGLHLTPARVSECGVISFVNPYSLLQVIQSGLSERELDRITFYVDGIALCRLAGSHNGVRFERLSFDFTSLGRAVLNDANRLRLRLAVVGATPAASDRFGAFLVEHFPQIETVLLRNGYFADAAEQARVAQSVAAAAPDLVLIGMGGGQQERFALQVADAGFAGPVYTCGGFIEQTALAGDRYYPEWIDRHNLRWLYRLAREPRRLFWRYAVDYPRFVALYLRHGATRP